MRLDYSIEPRVKEADDKISKCSLLRFGLLLQAPTVML